ncbi:hypothetical protein HispidOSU_018282, partial [Sigmodon hispidus]
QQLQMVLVNRAGTFPLTLAKFMSTTQTSTISLENFNLLLHGEHTPVVHLHVPIRHGTIFLVSVLVSSGLKSILAQPSALVLMNCVLTVQLLYHLLLWHS